MTDAGVGTGLGWWPRLVLWGIVIAVGSLYLLSVDRHRKDATPPVAGGSAALTAPPPGYTQGTASPEPVSATNSGAVPAVGGSPRLSPAPARAAERPLVQVTPPAGQLMLPPPRPATAAAAPPVAPPANPTVSDRSGASPPPAAAMSERGPESPMGPAASEASGAASSPAAGASTPPPQAPLAAESQMAVASEVSPVEARAFAEAVTEPHPVDREQPAAGPVSTATLEPGLGQEPEAPPTRTQTAAEAERARILAEYESLRRAAEAEFGPRGAWGPPMPYGRRLYGPPRAYPRPAPHGAPGPAAGNLVPSNPGW